MNEREAACRRASNPFCVSWGSLITTVLQTPMSYLHKEGDPCVAVIVSGVYGEVECEIQTRQAFEEEMLEAGAGHEAEVGATGCAVCGTREQIKKCGRCKVVGAEKITGRHKRVCVGNTSGTRCYFVEVYSRRKGLQRWRSRSRAVF